MGVGRGIGRTLRVPGRGVRRLVTVLVVLLLAATTGVAVSLSAPSLLVSLGLVEPPNLVPPAPRPVLVALPAGAPLPTEAGLAAVLDPIAEERELGVLTGVVLDPAAGTVLWQRSPEKPLAPASTAKLLTAAAVLLTLDPTDRLVTQVVAGAEPGTVVLVGGGDPTLTALPEGEDSVYPNAPRLAELAEQVQAAAPGPVRRVLVDTSLYVGPTLAEGWPPTDVAEGFVAPVESVMLDGGRQEPAIDVSARTEEPALDVGRSLARLLDADPDTVAVGTAPAGAAELGSVSSAMVSELVEVMLRDSENMLAEVLAREVALARGGEPSFTGAAKEVLAALAQGGFDTTGTVLFDGSGNSPDDRVPARLLGAVLAQAAAPAEGERDTELLRPILAGLPVAGGDGTLHPPRFDPGSAAAEGRGVVRAKTGTLTDPQTVITLAGVVTDDDGRLLVLALMSNGRADKDAVRAILDTFTAELADCGCR